MVRLIAELAARVQVAVRQHKVAGKACWAAKFASQYRYPSDISR